MYRMFNWMFEVRRAGLVALLFVVIALVPGVASGQEAEDPALTAADKIADSDKRFTQPPEDVVLPEIPNDIVSDPVGALALAVNEHSVFLGYPNVDHTSAIEGAGLSDEVAGRAAMLMRAVLDCPVPDGTPDDDVSDATSDATREQRLDCAEATNEAAVGVSRAMKESSSGDVDAWPALYIDGGGGDDTYIYDYSVLIDTGGNDVYDNNAGGNLLDNFHGPRGSAAPDNDTAVGCEHPHIVPQLPGTIAAPFDCIADRQTVLIDQKGKDQYGVFKTPTKRDNSPLPPDFQRMVDSDCTNDKVIRRIMTQGAALEGNALLMDEGGNDQYNGKTGSQGTGHVGGVGVLRDLGGTKDDYFAIRNSQGFSLVSGTGLLQDDGGNDRYHLYMPRPIDEDAPFGEEGFGGVVDDTDQCDRLPRMVQGAGISFFAPGGMGRLLDEGGKDTYNGNPPADQIFLPAENPASIFKFRHSSQGFGCDGTTGILEDKGKDKDTYRGGPKNRRDGLSVRDVETKCGTFVPVGVSIFEDDGPKGGKKGKKGK